MNQTRSRFHQQKPLASAQSYISIVSPRKTNGVPAKSASYKRPVTFMHHRTGSGTSSITAGRRLRSNLSSCSSDYEKTRLTPNQYCSPSLPTRPPPVHVLKNRTEEGKLAWSLKEDTRKMSTELEHTCEEAFNGLSSFVRLPAVESSPGNIQTSTLYGYDAPVADVAPEPHIPEHRSWSWSSPNMPPSKESPRSYTIRELKKMRHRLLTHATCSISDADGLPDYLCEIIGHLDCVLAQERVVAGSRPSTLLHAPSSGPLLPAIDEDDTNVFEQPMSEMFNSIVEQISIPCRSLCRLPENLCSAMTAQASGPAHIRQTTTIAMAEMISADRQQDVARLSALYPLPQIRSSSNCLLSVPLSTLSRSTSGRGGNGHCHTIWHL